MGLSRLMLQTDFLIRTNAIEDLRLKLDKVTALLKSD